MFVREWGRGAPVIALHPLGLDSSGFEGFGNVLARRELMIFLEEWLPAIPDFELDPERPPVFTSGGVNSVSKLYLKWKV